MAPASSEPVSIQAKGGISPSVRLAYVLQHFWQAYPTAQPVTIGYEPKAAGVTVIAGDENFFAAESPYPPTPNWRDWAGQRLPFFFDATPAMPLLTFTEGTAIINADIISAAFYLLSGWQEYFSPKRDRHGRFPYAASVQHQYGFVAVPVVDYYFDVLKTAVEHAGGQSLHRKPWRAGAAFAAFISHDVDNLQSAWKAPAKAALKRGNLLHFGQLLWQHLARPDAWDNLEAVAAATAEHGATSTFFVLPEPRPGGDGTPNADYVLTGERLDRLRHLQSASRCEIGLHGSIGTAEDERQLRRERQKLPFSAAGLRFHYLRWDPRRTPALVEAAGFDYDTTLGFAEHYGFRNSTCWPFYPFNFQENIAHHFLEISLNVMDATLHHPNYLQLRPEEIGSALRPMLDEIGRFGGVFSLLWHNENFDPANVTNGPREFAGIMEDLRQRGAAFLTGCEIVGEL